ncbi:hypothetical protein EYF80_063602 [Liparis tanakae]|uniref:Uncharacterized protein n=1 Tax=Liparis tanakae TaxID=230148 RepID=A0A4Z2EBZ1_9TELE|nr:hypothetical protein EYF80_063602 [Liparis tanakae]
MSSSGGKDTRFPPLLLLLGPGRPPPPPLCSSWAPQWLIALAPRGASRGTDGDELGGAWRLLSDHLEINNLFTRSKPNTTGLWREPLQDQHALGRPAATRGGVSVTLFLLMVSKHIIIMSCGKDGTFFCLRDQSLPMRRWDIVID